MVNFVFHFIRAFYITNQFLPYITNTIVNCIVNAVTTQLSWICTLLWVQHNNNNKDNNNNNNTFVYADIFYFVLHMPFILPTKFYPVLSVPFLCLRIAFYLLTSFVFFGFTTKITII